MTEHLTDRQIELYHAHTIAAMELVGLDSHAASCAECRRRLAATGQEEGKFLSLKKALDYESENHLDYERGAAYVDGALMKEEAGLIESHLSACRECHLMVSDLMVFRDEVAPDFNKAYAPAAIPSGPASLRRRLIASLNSVFTFRSPAPALSFAVMALFIIGVVFWLALRSYRPRDTGPQVAQIPTSTSAQNTVAQENNNPDPVPGPETAQPVLLALNDGARRVAIDKEGNLTGVEELSLAHRQAIKNALTTQQAANASALAGLGKRGGGLRGAGGVNPAFGPVNPVGKVILTDRPELNWSRLDGASHYRVIIYDSDFNVVSSSQELTTNNWTVPRALGRGRIYLWQVVANKDGQEVKAPTPPAQEARFKVLEQSRAHELGQARRSYAGSHLTLGVLYAQAGLLEEAEHEFKLLLKANPGSNVARNLLRNLRMMHRVR